MATERTVEVRRDGDRVAVYGQVAPGKLSHEEAQALHAHFGDAFEHGTADAALHAATELLTRGAYAEAIAALEQVGRAHPEHRSGCAGNIGVACFFLGRYEEAIAWYRNAKEWGAPADVIDDNIAEAEEARAASASPLGSPAAGVRPSAPAIAPVEIDPSVLLALLAPIRGSGMHVGDRIPAKKLANATEHVLPPSLRGEPILAIFDLTLFGSAKDAIVLTHRHLVIKDVDTWMTLEVADIAVCRGALGALDDRFSIGMRDGTTRDFPCGGHAEALTLLISGIARLRAARTPSAPSAPSAPRAYGHSIPVRLVAALAPEVAIEPAMLERALGRVRVIDPAARLAHGAGSTARFVVRGIPLAVEIVAAAWPVADICQVTYFDEPTKQRLAAHTAHARIVADDVGPPLERFLAGQHLASALAGPGGLTGVVLPDAMTFTPGARHAELFTPALEASCRLQLPQHVFTGFVQYFAEQGTWCASKGHEAFGVPNFATFVTPTEQPTDAADLFWQLFLYVHEQRATLAPGHTFQLGAGPHLRIAAVRDVAPDLEPYLETPGGTLVLLR
jgi:hypothetical protein